MAIDVQVSAVTALVVSGPKERQVYEGRGDDKKAKGRATDAEGRPVSAITAVVLCERWACSPTLRCCYPTSRPRAC